MALHSVSGLPLLNICSTAFRIANQCTSVTHVLGLSRLTAAWYTSSFYQLQSHYSNSQIIHLEYGTCSNIDCIDLNKLAAECRRWHCFIDGDCRDDLLDVGDTNYLDNPFMCPTCQATLPKLSSLFQHIESSACEQTLDDNRDIGQLRKFLASRLR
jgi:hypothetical protein